MKLTKFILLFALTVAAVGCNKNDDNQEPPYELTRANFVDTYSMNFLEFRTVETVTFNNGSTSTSTTEIKGTLFQNVNFVFNADNTFAATGLYTTVQTTINPDGSIVTDDPVIHDAAVEIGSGTYSLNTTSKILTISTSGNSPEVYEITIYSPTEMIIYSESEITVGNSTTLITQEAKFSR